MKKYFFGGVHPRYKKKISQNAGEIGEVIPKRVIIPMLQHIGKPCTPLVNVGDYVLKGQKIGDGEGRTVPVHASVSGTVSAIEELPHPNGYSTISVIIENDFKESLAPISEYSEPIEQMDIEEMLHRIREAGIIGMGGAAFPGNIKALSALGNIDTLIANGCECEPYITADDMLMRKNPQGVFEGVMLLRHILAPERAVIAVEDNKPEAIAALYEVGKQYPQIEIKVLPTRYPQGSEKQLIQALTGREVPPNGLPTDADCVVFNVSTFAAINEAVKSGAPLIERIITVSGEGVVKPQNFKVRIGTTFQDLIDAAGGLKEGTNKVISGGPMMGIAQERLDIPAVKATNSVLALLPDKNSEGEGSVCIRCGRCVSACPMHLKPLYIHRYANEENKVELRRLNVTDCIECGCCSYVCPAKISLVESCRLGKKLLKEEVSE